MWIRGFQKTIQNSLEDHTLKNDVVVIDAQNFFFNTYKNSCLQFVFGCESEKYTQYLKNYLSMFKKANIKCYFIFKGGHENFENIKKNGNVTGKEFVIGEECGDIIIPIAMKYVHKQVLDAMDFDYAICEFESKKECIALAETLGCALISDDFEFCFAGIPYIPYKKLKFNECTSSIDCRLFALKTFLEIHRLTEDKLSIFIALTDIKLIPENYTEVFKKTYKIRSHEVLLKWLCQRNKQTALDTVSKSLPSEFRAKFVQAEMEARNFVRPKVTVNVASLYLKNRDTFEITENDPLWFEKGVAADHISIEYINLYHHGSVVGSWTRSLQNKKSEDAMLLSMELMIYAYNLMTNYKNTEIKFMTYDDEPKTIMFDDSVPKPNYEVEVSVFENGWREIISIGLFQHFLKNSLSGFNYETLENLPDDARLLMVALIYFSTKKPEETTGLVCSILLSYIVLGVIFENTDGNNNQRASKTIPLTTNKSDILQEDITIASGILEEYFNPVSAADAKKIFDGKLNHALLEFQHCLVNFNSLNTLCGSSYKPTVYSKTFNGTFAYKIFHEIMTKNGGDGLSFVNTKLTPAASVLAFFNGLAKFCSDSVNDIKNFYNC